MKGSFDVRRVMVIFGTRPEAIKMAPAILALKESPAFEPIVAVTAQHRSMLDQVLDLFSITPDHDLNIIEPRQTLTGVTLKALGKLSPLVEATKPDVVLVQGDTTTTFIGALAAFYNQVPVVHMEAGLRTGMPYSPFPEEINRCLTTRLSSLHLAPTSSNKTNLLVENIAARDVVVTGNTVIDALLHTVDRKVDYDEPALDGIDEVNRRVLLVTAHRRESWGEPMKGIGRALARIARAHPDLLIVFPMHKNPLVREAIMPSVSGLDNVIVVEPLAYGAFARLMNRADVILTDSGGVQEEAPSLGKPVLVMRDTTERPEAMLAGTVKLVGAEEDAIVAATDELLRDDAAYAEMANAVNPYGDGFAAERTVHAIAHFLGDGPPVEEFSSHEVPAASNAVSPSTHSAASVAPFSLGLEDRSN
ncbi:MAG: UDP-N-acetylglucosamine 2-epimerase (non-hydrolyzing) [Actinomycetota bacterium]|nr:UDP-N-acetylglucosamine 2-epimerase (non-hydrolyzing) [Actinomycetota bacterium]